MVAVDLLLSQAVFKLTPDTISALSEQHWDSVSAITNDESTCRLNGDFRREIQHLEIRINFNMLSPLEEDNTGELSDHGPKLVQQIITNLFWTTEVNRLAYYFRLMSDLWTNTI